MELGDLAKDTLTDFTGVVVCLSSFAFNSERVALRSRALDHGKPREAEWFDTCLCEVVQAGVVPAVEVPAMPFAWLETVRDAVTGLTGKVVGYSTHLTGCLRVGIQPLERTKDHLPLEVQWFAHDELSAVAPAEAPRASPRTGGPMPAPRAPRDARL